MISIDKISVTYDRGGPLERRVLRDLSLEVPASEFVCIIGTNGAGKSTLLGAIAGDVATSSGRIVIGGVDVTRMPTEQRARLVARVFQDPLAGSCGSLSIAENLILAASRGRGRGLSLALRGKTMRQVAERVADLGIGLEDRLSSPMGSLSGGQRQALSLVMATLAPSNVLLLDEHTAALDPGNAEFVLELTQRFARQFGLTVLMVTHSMRQALEVGTRTLMLHDGSVALDLSGERRKGLTVDDLVAEFRRRRGAEFAEETMLDA